MTHFVFLPYLKIQYLIYFIKYNYIIFNDN
nr:MAG TPA: hypothetical protein [Bacteriophage sp.]